MPIIQQVRNGRADCLRVLLGAGADPNASDQGEVNSEPVRIAIERCKLGLLRTLMDHGAVLSLKMKDVGCDDTGVISLSRTQAHARCYIVLSLKSRNFKCVSAF